MDFTCGMFSCSFSKYSTVPTKREQEVFNQKRVQQSTKWNVDSVDNVDKSVENFKRELAEILIKWRKMAKYVVMENRVM